ncbi:hypothetical protein [Streptomyces sp. A5-4]|uniref:hypothetical protein n=1 Tax=Streptomyces sp. A5-4 TaxID=3384771 RepID=UPI003DA80800
MAHVTDAQAALLPAPEPAPEVFEPVVEWSGSFTPVGVTDSEAVALFHGIYRDGLTALKTAIGG